MPKSPQIAIVDDDQAVREALHDLLQVEGLSARVFESAQTFLAAQQSGDFDCLITDLRMPEVDGILMLERLRSRGSRLPTIFITSVRDDAARKRAFAAGAAAWLTKPVADKELLDALQAILVIDQEGDS